MAKHTQTIRFAILWDRCLKGYKLTYKKKLKQIKPLSNYDLVDSIHRDIKILCLLCFYSCLQTATLLKRRLCHRCFPVNFAKFRRKTFFAEHIRWLLLFTFWIQSETKVFCKNIKFVNYRLFDQETKYSLQ